MLKNLDFTKYEVRIVCGYENLIIYSIKNFFCKLFTGQELYWYKLGHRKPDLYSKVAGEIYSKSIEEVDKMLAKEAK